MKRRLLILTVILLSFTTFSNLFSPSVVYSAGVSCPGTQNGAPLTSVFTGTGTQTLTIVFPPGAYGLGVPITPEIIKQTITGGSQVYILKFHALPGQTWLQCNYGGAYVQSSSGGSSGGSSGSSSAPPAGYFGPLYYDGRLNDKDGQETSAIYCLGDGSVRVYIIGTPDWTIDFIANRAEIAKVSKNPAHNTLIKKGHFASLSRQSNGLLLVSSPGLNPKDGDYTFTFSDCGILVGM